MPHRGKIVGIIRSNILDIKIDRSSDRFKLTTEMYRKYAMELKRLLSGTILLTDTYRQS